jgi:hypothetical protein
MQNEGLNKNISHKKDGMFFKGQKVLYKGANAQILHVKPVLVIKLLKKNQVVCGNVYEDVRPM